MPVKFGEVDFPDELICARNVGELVVFAGAGVSMGTPSSLPDFNGLADMIGREVGVRRDRKLPDKFLGGLKRNGTDVHALATNILSNPYSQYKTVHLDLLRIYHGNENVRLVTTNLDNHFESAATRLFGRNLLDQRTMTHSATALPIGNQFSGIVHVHGWVYGEKRGMILTDDDFGRAYLNERFASRFLTGAFQTNAVMFIGYSLGDTILQYLLRSVPKGSVRFYALVLNTDTNLQAHYIEHDVQMIIYPRNLSGKGMHAELDKAIHEWANFINPGAKYQDYWNQFYS